MDKWIAPMFQTLQLLANVPGTRVHAKFRSVFVGGSTGKMSRSVDFYSYFCILIFQFCLSGTVDTSRNRFSLLEMRIEKATGSVHESRGQ